MPDSDGLPVSEQEIGLLRELTAAGVPFMLVGLGAAVVQGADAVTKDLDLWFQSILHPGLAAAAQKVGAAFIWRNSPPLEEQSAAVLRTRTRRYRCGHQVRRPS